MDLGTLQEDAESLHAELAALKSQKQNLESDNASLMAERDRLKAKVIWSTAIVRSTVK